MQNFDKQCLQVFFKISANVYNYNTNNKKNMFDSQCPEEKNKQKTKTYNHYLNKIC
jgi:hypothetical protein